MVKDHYIAQAYLKHFGDAKFNGMLHVYRKSGVPTYFKCWPQDVCHEWDGDLNPAFIPHRPELLGDFRKMCEPHWNASIEGLLLGNKISDHDKFAISAYFSNLMTCTPTWRRVGVAMYNRQLADYMSFAKKMKEKHGGQPNLPVEAIEMMERGELTIHTDPDYIKAVVTRHLLEHACMMYNQNWIVLTNNTDQPFITSDNPVAILYSGQIGEPMTRFLPITPRLCLSVTYDISTTKILKTQDHSLDFLKPSIGDVVHEKVTIDEAKYVNRLVAMCAEEMVFSSVKSKGVEVLVNKYGKFGIDIDYVELPTGREDSIYRGSIIRVRERS